MRIAVTGCGGQIVHALLQRASERGWPRVIAVGRPELDLTLTNSITPALERARPDVVVNAAAYTSVDRAESEPELAMAVNRDGAAAVARATNRLGLPLIHISTDYVFSGDKAEPYSESDPAGPLQTYGRTKLAGEEAVRAEHSSPIILRTAWLYGTHGSNFIKTMLALARARERVRVVDDQIGNPTSALDAADGILRIISQISRKPGCQGTYHMSGSGESTWCGLARHVFAISKRGGGPWVEVEAVPTSDYPTPARRPRNSRLDNRLFEATFGGRLPSWQDSVARCVDALVGKETPPAFP